MDAVTETSGRPHGPAALLGGRGWVHFAWWLFAWNVGTPIRLLGGMPHPSGIGRAVGGLLLDQTSWAIATYVMFRRSEEHTSELQSRLHLVCRLLLEKKNTPLFHRGNTIR